MSSSTSEASPVTTRPSGADQLGLKNSSNLYLITFLATLFLLLFISCTIVLRSFIIRRRFQRRLDEAYAAGIILAPRAQGSRKRRYGHRPKMFTSWITEGGTKWREMMPVSVLPIQVKRRSKHSSIHNQRQQRMPSRVIHHASAYPESRFQRRWLRAWYQGRDEINPDRPDDPESPTIASPEKPTTTIVDMLQVAVLVAMPSPNNPVNRSTTSIDKLSDEEDEKLPHLVMGVTRLPYKHSNQMI